MTEETRQQWAEINAILNPPQAEEALPQPLATPPGLTPAQQETLFEN